MNWPTTWSTIWLTAATNDVVDFLIIVLIGVVVNRYNLFRGNIAFPGVDLVQIGKMV